MCNFAFWKPSFVCGVASAILLLLKALRYVNGFLPEPLDDQDVEGVAEEEREVLAAAQARQASCIRRLLGEEGDAVDPRPKKQLRVATSLTAFPSEKQLRLRLHVGS